MSHVESNNFAAHMNVIRKIWVEKLTPEVKAMFKAMPPESRFAHYASIDLKINNLYTGTLRHSRENNIKVNADDILHTVAESVVAELTQTK